MRVREWCSAHGEGARWAKEKGKSQRRKSYAQNIKEGGNPQEVELGKSGENDKGKMRREGEIQRRKKSNIRWRDAGLKKFKRRNDMGPEKEGRNLMVKKKQTDGKQTHALSEVLERYDRSQSYLSSIRLFLPSLITVRVHKQLVGWRMEKWRRERGHCDVRGGGGGV